MKELVKERAEFLTTELIPKYSSVLYQIGVAVLGFFMAKTSLWGGISPLGISLSAGMPLNLTPMAGLGSVLGYILSSSNVASLKYCAALLAIIVIRFILAGIKPALNSSLLSGIVSFTVTFGVGIASSVGGNLSIAVLGLAEAMLAGGGAYFIRRATSLKIGRTSGFSQEQIACILIALNLAFASLYSLQIDGVSLGRIMAVTAILLCCRYGRTGTAAVCSISAAISMAVSGFGSELAMFVCFSGLAAGVFSALGKIASAIAFIAVSILWTLLSSASPTSVAVLIESVTASVIFLLLPKTLGAAIGRIISPPVSTPDTAGLRRTLTMRLDFAACALKGISETVEDVARCLAIGRKPSFSSVLHNIENDACRGCSLMLHCWERDRKSTTDSVLSMCEAVRRCQPVSVAETPQEFKEKCLRLERFENTVAKNYSDFQSKLSAEKRMTEMRDIVSDQLGGISNMLTEMSEEFSSAYNYDVTLAGRVAASLKELDIRASECSCVVDKFGRMTVEIALSQMPDLPINRAKILSHIEEVCERDFEPPEINRTGNKCYITVTEKALFSVDAHITQFNQGQNQLCGDTCKYFLDGRGRFLCILSDGMGSGGRAAVDSAMTVSLTERLIKAGFGFDCALRLVNSAMLFKSTDETLSTLDISCIDLHSGKAQLLKAGAAPTLVRRNGRTGRAECRSLPAGILHDVGFDKASVTLKEGDILVMISDGACSDGSDWICAELEAWQDGGAKQLSEHLATAARRRRHDGHDDDITVFAAIMEKAV